MLLFKMILICHNAYKSEANVPGKGQHYHSAHDSEIKNIFFLTCGEVFSPTLHFLTF